MTASMTKPNGKSDDSILNEEVIFASYASFRIVKFFLTHLTCQENFKLASKFIYAVLFFTAN